MIENEEVFDKIFEAYIFAKLHGLPENLSEFKEAVRFFWNQSIYESKEIIDYHFNYTTLHLRENIQSDIQRLTNKEILNAK